MDGLNINQLVKPLIWKNLTAPSVQGFYEVAQMGGDWVASLNLKPIAMGTAEDAPKALAAAYAAAETHHAATVFGQINFPGLAEFFAALINRSTQIITQAAQSERVAKAGRR